MAAGAGRLEFACEQHDGGETNGNEVENEQDENHDSHLFPEHSLMGNGLFEVFNMVAYAEPGDRFFVLGKAE